MLGAPTIGGERQAGDGGVRSFGEVDVDSKQRRIHKKNSIKFRWLLLRFD